MIKRTVFPRDLELLSAYLDKQLNQVDNSRLENRLRNDPALQVELESLLQTLTMLRSLPHRRAPHNFTLSPVMVGARPKPVFQPAFGVVSALAVVLLIFVVISDLLVLPGYVGMFQVGKAPTHDESSFAQKALQAAPEEVLVFPTPLPTPMETAGPALAEPAVEAVAEAANSELSGPTQEVGAMADAMPEATPEERLVLEAPPPDQSQIPPAEEGLATAKVMTATLEMTATQVLTTTLMLTSTLEVQLAPTEALALGSESEQTLPADQTEGVGEPPAAVEISADSSRGSQLWIQVIFWMGELLLVSVTIAAGLATFYSWNKSRR